MKLGSKMSAESRAKLSAAHMGKVSRPAGWEHSAETRAKMSEAGKGRTGELSHNWRGDDIGTDAAHLRHGKVLPQMCAHADETCKGRLEIAFDHDTPAEYVRVDPRSGCSYSTRVEDYLRLCRSHHRRYDNAIGRKDEA